MLSIGNEDFLTDMQIPHKTEIKINYINAFRPLTKSHACLEQNEQPK